MLHDSTQRLILKLHEMTSHGEIAWKEGERRCSVYETEGYQVEIEADPPGLRILQSDGRELERVQEADLRRTPWPGGDSDFASRMSEMAERAHRVARGAEAAIETIMSSLSTPARAVSTPAAATPAAPAPDNPEPAASELASQRSASPSPASPSPASPSPIVVAPSRNAEPAHVLSLTRNQPVARFGPSFGSIASFTRPGSLAQPAITPTRPEPDSRIAAEARAHAPAPAPADVYKPWV